jgi:hypothetical protein
MEVALRGITTVTLLLALGVLAGCSEPISDTGYVGTWSRGNDKNTSYVWIREAADGYEMRWGVGSADGVWRVDCSWDGYCEEFVNSEKTAEHRYEVRIDPDTDKLMFECSSKQLVPEVAEAHYIDLLEVTPDGLGLWSYTLERDGNVFPENQRPKRLLKKISDEVPESSEAS